MLFEPSACIDILRSEVGAARDGELPWGLPANELDRSPVAKRLARFAGEHGLGLFHFEHRVALDLPEAWVPEGQAQLVEAPQWEGGVLPEAKYQSFRHDQALGSFHPHHRAKWGTHELCHGLVGFGWRSGASTFELATMARLAELLPVVLWYFLDEAFLRRCPVHGPGALFRKFCADCERVASCNAADSLASSKLAEGAQFLDRELAAIERSRRSGRPVPHVWTSLDLCSDGIAYAVAHKRRLRSEAFANYMDVQRPQVHDLEALQERVISVARAIVGAETTLAVRGCREDWILEDVAWRLWQIWEETEGSARHELERICVAHADARDIGATIADYSALQADYVLPLPQVVFAVGYPLGVGGLGRSVEQVWAGLKSVAHTSSQVVEDAERMDFVDAFVGQDAPTRKPLIQRWRRFVSNTSLGDLACYEEALALARPDPLAVLGAWEAGDGRLADGVHLLQLDLDPVATAHHVETGAYRGIWDGALRMVTEEGEPIETTPTRLLIAKNGSGELILLDVPEDLAAALDNLPGPVALPSEQTELLTELGLLLPARWSCD